jgi:hypothetical protein
VLLPFWRRVLEARGVAARCVIPVRHPLAVAGSLARRDGFAPEKSVLVWSAYMLAAEAYTRDLPRAFVGYDALIADWRSEAARMEAAHGAPLPKLTEAAGKRIDRFLSPDLRHNADHQGLERLGWAGEIAGQVFDWFAARAAGGDPEPAALAQAAAALEARRQELGGLVSSTTRDLAAVRAELFETRQKLQAAQAFQADLEAEREQLKAGWRADQQRLTDALWTLDQINVELEASLADD